jgi:cAMP-dependent protein kinase regulator
MYLQEKVNPILEALVTAVLLERPEEPDFFMLKWLCEQTKTIDASEGQRGSSSTTDEIAEIRKEIEKQKERKAQLEAKKASASSRTDPKADAKPSEVKSDEAAKVAEEDDDDEDEEEDDGPDEIPDPPKMNRGPRQSVSAEAYGVWNQKSLSFVAPVYDKTAEQKTRIETCLESSFLFNGLDKQDFNTLVLAFKEKKATAGERVIQQGDDGDCMYMIETGAVNCLKKGGDDEKVVKTCGCGEVFGELALLYNCARAASVEATEDGTLWVLDRETFNYIVKDAASKKRDTYTEFLKKVPLFANMDTYEMMTIADALKVETKEKDSQIIQQGDVGDRFYIILDGECVAKQSLIPGQPEQEMMVHKVGDYFGELALIKNQPRAASVYSSARETKLLSMDRKTFKRLLGPIAEILRREAVRYDV